MGLLVVFSIAVVVAYCLFVLGFFGPNQEGSLAQLQSWQHRAYFGDTASGLSAIFSGFSFFLLIWTWELQRRELSLSRKALELAQEELNSTNKLLDAQKKEMQKSQDNQESALLNNAAYNLYVYYNEVHKEAKYYCDLNASQYKTQKQGLIMMQMTAGITIDIVGRGQITRGAFIKEYETREKEMIEAKERLDTIREYNDELADSVKNELEKRKYLRAESDDIRP